MTDPQPDKAPACNRCIKQGVEDPFITDIRTSYTAGKADSSLVCSRHGELDDSDWTLKET